MGGTHFLQTGYLLLNRNAPYSLLLYMNSLRIRCQLYLYNIILLEMLKDGEMLSSDCEERLEAAGFKKSTIKKAKKKAEVISQKKGFLWYWSLPMGDIPRE